MRSSVAKRFEQLDPRIRVIMGVQVLAVFGIVLGVAAGRIGFALALLAFVGVFFLTGVAYGYLLVFGG